MKRKFLLINYLFSIFLVSNLYAQNRFPPESDLVDSKYYEGFRKYRNVNVGEIELISFLSKYSDNVQANTSQFNISFYIPINLKNEDIDIFIEEIKQKSYYVIPAQKSWPNGNQTFTWNSKKARKNKIGISDLNGLAKLKKYDNAQFIIPITFYDSNKPYLREHYEFVFVANRTTNLRYSIYNRSEKLIVSNTFKNQVKNKKMIIKWNCRNVKSGKYILFIEYVFTSGERNKGENTYEFYHERQD